MHVLHVKKVKWLKNELSKLKFVLLAKTKNNTEVQKTGPEAQG